VVGQDCVDAPQIGIANPGYTNGLCSPYSIAFPIFNFEDNSEETVYYVDFGDGSPELEINHPPPIQVSHTYTNTSCGFTTPEGSQNAYMFKITAVNECGTSIATVDPIRIHHSSNPIISGPSVVSVNELVTFVSTSTGAYASSDGVCQVLETYWQVQLPPEGDNNIALFEAIPSYSQTATTSFSTTFLEPGEYNLYVIEYHPVCGSDDGYFSVEVDNICDENGNQLDALGVCGGDCPSDYDVDGICDDVDDCFGVNDECGVCNGPGAIYECGCDDIPEGDCDCDGNQPDALGVCDGGCAADADVDGVCDDVDDCVGALDECGVCNGDGAVYECGCEDIPEGDCDCGGNQLDALGICGGYCAADADSDGVCDDVDDCVGAYDECGVCNGPGAIYECGCADIPDGDCDCDGTLYTTIVVDCECEQLDPATYTEFETLVDQENCLITENCYCECNNDTDGDGVCDENEIVGCTDSSACNYSPSATDHSNSCIFIGDSCDDLNPLTFDDYVDEDCFCGGIEITTVNELEALQVRIYPNPASNNLTIDLGALTGLNTTIKIYDSSSKLVFEKQSTSKLLIDVSTYAKGLYTLEISNTDKVYRSQILIQ